MSEKLMAIFLVFSTCGITSGKKNCRGLKWRPFWKFWNIKHSFNLISDMKRSSQSMQKKYFAWWWRHRWRLRVTSKSLFLYKLNNDIFMITMKWTNISSLNFLCIGFTKLWLHLYKCVFMTSLVTSRGHKVGQILKLIYLRQNLS